MAFYTKYKRPPRISSPVGETSLTDSQFLKDCDINEVMKRCAAGDTSLVQSRPGVFADVSDIGTFAECMDKMVDARREFELLPSLIRKKFGNDPRLLVEFLADSSNDEEAIKLGLKVKPKKSDPVEVVLSKSSSVIEATANKSGQEGNS